MSVLEAAWTDRLDKAGQWQVNLPLTDPRTQYAEPGRIWIQYREGEGFVFAGRIETVRKTPEDTLQLSGPTLLDELVYSNVKQARVWNDTDLEDVVDDLLAGTGWTRDGSVTTHVSLRSEADSRLKALISAVEQAGSHFRETISESGGALTRYLELGAFGTVTGLVITSHGRDPIPVAPGTIAFVDELTVIEDGTKIFNWILPLAAGDGGTSIDLRYQTRCPSLLLNGSFEASTLGGNWTNNAAAGATFEKVLNEVGVEGDWVYHCVNPAAGGDADLYQDVTVVAGRIYCLEGYIWPVQEDTQFALVEWYNAAAALISTDNIAMGTLTIGQWNRFADLTLTAPALAVTARIILRHDGGAAETEAYWDYIRFWRQAANASQPYDVLTELTDPTQTYAQLNWYITDAASVAASGQRERVYLCKDLVLVGQSDQSLENTSNALYDRACAYLTLAKDPLTSYEISVRELPPTIRPGDIVRLRWRGMARRHGEDYMYLSIEDDLWIMERTREFADDGTEKSSLVVSTQAASLLEQTDTNLVAATQNTLQQETVYPQTAAKNNYTRTIRMESELSDIGPSNTTDLKPMVEIRLPAHSISPSGGFVLECGGSILQENVGHMDMYWCAAEAHLGPAHVPGQADTIHSVEIDIPDTQDYRRWYARMMCMQRSSAGGLVSTLHFVIVNVAGLVTGDNYYFYYDIGAYTPALFVWDATKDQIISVMAQLSAADVGLIYANWAKLDVFDGVLGPSDFTLHIL